MGAARRRRTEPTRRSWQKEMIICGGCSPPPYRDDGAPAASRGKTDFLFASQKSATMAIARSVRSTLPFEPFDEGSVTRYAPIRVRCGISPFVAVVSKAARGHPVARLGLLARPLSRVKRRNHHRKRWFLEVRVLDFQSLLRDCRNRRRPSGIQVQYSFRNPRA